jgi:hypothetical protein
VFVSATSKRKKKIPLLCGPGVAVTQGEREKAGGLRLQPVGPAHYAARGQEKAAGLRDWKTGRARRAGPSGRKLRREKISIFFSFSNISNAFSNSF